MKSENLEKLKLMVVGDDSGDLDLLDRGLRRDFEVFKANGSMKALEVLDTVGEVPIIICDEQRYLMNGIEILSRVNDCFSETLGIIIVPFGHILSDKYLESIKSSNVFQVFSKPYNPEYLRAVVHYAADIYRMLKQETNERRQQLFLNERQSKKSVLHLLRSLSEWEVAEVLGLDIEEVRKAAQ